MRDPRYRFRGSIAPSAEVKRPVRAEVLTMPAGDSAAVLHLDDVIDSWGGEWGISAREFTTALSGLGDVARIDMHINSPGGEVFEGIAILNALRRHPARVVATVTGLAASAASFIAAGADEVVMAPNSQMMIHDAWGLAMGPAQDMHDMGDRLDKLSDNIASVYAGRAGGDVQSWRKAMLAESWYSDAEAVAVGLADRIEDTRPADSDAIANAFDLSVFRHSGRQDAPPPVVDAAPGLDSESAARLDRYAARVLARHAITENARRP